METKVSRLVVNLFFFFFFVDGRSSFRLDSIKLVRIRF